MSADALNHIVVFGKGGVGKSTFASNLSAYYASRGLKVLHVGCDPKSDSTLILLEDMDNLNTVMSWISNADDTRETGRVFNPGRLGIKCIEAGGPEAGIGCGGRGIAKVMEYLDKMNVLDREKFDVVVFDVLGDVVCGGFAAPLRKGFGNKVVMVIAEDEMSYYAANNIARAVLRYRVNGVALSGIVINERGGGGPRLKAGEFASMIGARVLGKLPLSETPSMARREGLTAVEYDSESDFSRTIASVAEELLKPESAQTPPPSPLDQKLFMKYLFNPEDPETLHKLKSAKSDEEEEPAKAHEPRDTNRRADRGRGQGKLKDAFSHLLGLRGNQVQNQGYDVDYVEKIPGGGVEIGFEGPVIKEMVVLLKPRDPGSTPELATEHFDVFLASGKLRTPHVKVLRNVAHRLGRFYLEELEAIYGRCMAPAGGGEDGEGPDGVPDLGREPAEEDKWARFFATWQFSRNKDQSLEYRIPVSQVFHSDLECCFATPSLRKCEFTPYNYPWILPSLQTEVQKKFSDSRAYTTLIGDMDVIFGAANKLERAMDDAVEEIGNRKLLVLNSTCVPMVYGEDVPSILSDYRKRCPVPMIYEGPDNSISVNPFTEFFLKMKEETGFAEKKQVPGTVNLVGFPVEKGLEEIVKALAGMGVEVNSYFIPEIDPMIFENYRAASLTVFYPDKGYGEMYEKVFGDVPVKRISPVAPYGMRGTGEWLRMVAEQAGAQGDMAEGFAGAPEDIMDKWNRLKEQASSLTLGFVLAGPASEIITNPDILGGVPVLDLLREMGFGIQMLKYAPSSARDGVAEGDAGIFSSRDELEELLKKSQAGCFYSDYYFDHRLVKAGKGQFSLQFFEMGYRGAVSTLERLVAACTVSFFRDYAKYL